MSSGRRHQQPPVTVLSNYDQRILADTPTMYLLLSGGSAGVADRTGNGYKGLAVNGPTITSFPNNDAATAFDGATQYIEVSNNTALSVPNTGILTLEAWIRPDALQFAQEEGSGYVYWMGKNTSNESEYACRMYSFTNSESPPRPNRISGYAFNLTGGLGAGSYFQDPVTVGQWLHYVFIINTLNTSSTYPTGYTTIYKNGLYRQQRSLEAWNIVPANGTAPFRVGSVTLNSYFQGAVAKVAVYGYELSASAIRDHYQIVFPPATGSTVWISSVGVASTTASGTTLTITIGSAGVSAGSTLIVRVTHSFTAAGPTVVDSRGNTYTRDQTSPNGASTMRASLFSAPINNSLQPGDVILLTTPATTAVRLMAIDQFSGVVFSSPLDVKNSTSNAGSTTPGTTIPITPTNADDLLIGFVAVLGPSSESYTEDTLEPWHSLTRLGTTGGATNMTVDSVYQVVGSTSAHHYQPTLGTSESWIEIIAAYKAGNSTPIPTQTGSVLFIQNIGSATSQTAGNSLTITVPSEGVTAGHTLIVRVLHDYTTGAPAISDSQGNTYTRDRTAADTGTTIRASQYSCPITTALLSGDIITITLSAAATARVATIDEFSRVIAPIVIDTQNGISGSSTLPSLFATTTHADDLLIGMVAVAGDGSDTYTEDTANLWTSLSRIGTTGGTFSTNRTINSAYRGVASANTYHYAPTLTTSSLWIEFFVVYEAS